MLKVASEWFFSNRLSLNAKKTKCILFSPNGYSPPLYRPLIIDNEPIERIGNRFRTKYFKLVGVRLDDQINWKEQAMGVSNKIAISTYALARIKKSVPRPIKLQIYNSLIKCHLEYCTPIWGNCVNSNKKEYLNHTKKGCQVHM